MIYGYAIDYGKGQAQGNDSTENHIQILKKAGAEKIYEDTFTTPEMRYLEFSKLHSILQPGDTIIVSKLNQFANNISKVSEMIIDMIDEGITINALDIGIISNNTMSTLMRDTLISFARFDRDIIVQRIQEGKAIAKATNPDFKEGRPPKYNQEQLDYAMRLLEKKSYSQVVKLTGISRATLYRERKKRKILLSDF